MAHALALRLKSKTRSIIGIDIGGTKIVVYHSPSRFITHQYTTAVDAVSCIYTAISDSPDGTCFAISLAGIIRQQKNRASIYCPHIPFAQTMLNTLFKKIKKSHPNSECYLLNDADAFTYGQYILQRFDVNTTIFTGITLGTGIGAGIFHAGSFLLGEIGHQYTHTFRLEQYCSGTGIQTNFSLLTGKIKSAKAIFELQNQASNSVIQSAQTELAKGLANLIHICGCTHIVFGGSLSEQEQFILETIKQVPLYLVHPSLMPTTSIAQTGIESCAFGAQQFVHDGLYTALSHTRTKSAHRVSSSKKPEKNRPSHIIQLVAVNYITQFTD
jgi:predicted NBD/HSP70 family sugar kinase